MRSLLIAVLCSSCYAGEVLHDLERAQIAAKGARGMLLVSCEPTPVDGVAAHLSSSDRLKGWTLCRLTGGSASAVAACSSLVEMHGAGVFIVDYAHAEHDGQIVSLLPFRRGKYYRFQPSHLDVLAGLPPGSLTQRSMVFAVRIHPDRPRSTEGEWSELLAREACGHSEYQARVCVQGHQGWDGRYARIREAMGGRATEVAAESWENQDLIDSCVDCTLSWRQSSGHWRAVVSPCDRYGYDIRRGRNGIWYGTGIVWSR